MAHIPHRRSGGNRRTRLLVLGLLLVTAGSLAAWRLLRDPTPEKVDPKVIEKANQIQANIQKASTGPVPDSAPVQRPAEIQKSTSKRGPTQAPK